MTVLSALVIGGLSGCSPAPEPAPSSSSVAPSTGAGSASSPATGWAEAVRAENARPGTTSWRIDTDHRARAGVEAFADQVSVRPGQAFGLYVSASGQVDVHAYRMGFYGGTGAREVYSGTATAEHQPGAAPLGRPLAEVGGVVPARTVVAPWQRTMVIPTDGWPEGAYLLTVTSAYAGSTRYVPLTLRSATGRDRLVVVSSMLTSQAYNDWGGHSLYHGPEGTLPGRSLAVSFDRPYAADAGAGQFLHLDAPILWAAEEAGLPLAWATDYDLAVDPTLLDGAAGVVFGGHSEYWTPRLRSAVVQAVGRGTNLASFGANTAYWRVRLAGAARDSRPPSLAQAADGRPRVAFVSKDLGLDPLAHADPAGATVKFRDHPSPLPETEFLGVAYDCNPVEDDWVIADPGWWGFEGTGVRAGTRLRGMAGNEIDRAYAGAPRPGPAQVVAYDKVTCRGAQTAYTGLYTSTPGGAGVFAAGTLGWPQGLSSPDAETARLAAAITRRVLTEFAQPAAGRRHPARDTTGHYWLPARRTTSYTG